jgi:hypothetical protein
MNNISKMKHTNVEDNRHFSLNIFSFFIAFLVGVLYVYIDTPKARTIIKYPTPYNTNKMVYKGLTDECFKFKATEVKCSTGAIPQPII